MPSTDRDASLGTLDQRSELRGIWRKGTPGRGTQKQRPRQDRLDVYENPQEGVSGVMWAEGPCALLCTRERDQTSTCSTNKNSLQPITGGQILELGEAGGEHPHDIKTDI